MKTQKPILHARDHAPGGADPIPGLYLAGDTIDAIIAGLDPAGWWKLNESTGSVAHDSSGNGLDLTVDGSFLDPLWGAPAGPPGEQAADFEHGTGGLLGTASRVARSWAPLTGDFTAGIFVNRNSTDYTMVMGQGNPGRSGGKGWQIDINGTTDSPFQHPHLLPKGVSTAAVSDNALAASTWAMLAAVHESTSWRLNINGLDQAAIGTGGSYVPVSAASPLWIGHDGAGTGVAVTQPQFVGSYAFLIPSALSGAQLLEIYNSAVLPGGANEGKALLATGLGGTYWDFAIEVTY